MPYSFSLHVPYIGVRVRPRVSRMVASVSIRVAFLAQESALETLR